MAEDFADRVEYDGVHTSGAKLSNGSREIAAQMSRIVCHYKLTGSNCPLTGFVHTPTMPAAAKLRPLLNQSVDDQLSPRGVEFELLVSCCAPPLSHGGLEGVLHGQYDWQTFISLAEHHCVVPQVYRSLAPFMDKVPLRDFATLRSKYQEKARSALWFTSELVRILQHLECQGIGAIPYKGPALAQILYGDVTARQFSDLDILVRPEEVPKAKLALAEVGYTSRLELTASSERACISSGHEFGFDGVAGPHLLELQWRIVPRFYSIEFDMASFFQRAGQVTLGTHKFPTLSADDLLLVLCVHAAKHLWLQLSWLCDIAELARSPRIGWDSVCQRSRQLGIQRAVAVNLLLAHDLLGSPLPHQMESWLDKDRESEVLKDEVLQVIRCSLPFDTESPTYFRFMLRLRERWRDQCRFLWRLLWTPSLSEWTVVNLPGSLSWFYRGIRFFRLAKRFAALAWARTAFFLASERPVANPRSTTFL